MVPEPPPPPCIPWGVAFATAPSKIGFKDVDLFVSLVYITKDELGRVFVKDDALLNKCISISWSTMSFSDELIAFGETLGLQLNLDFILGIFGYKVFEPVSDFDAGCDSVIEGSTKNFGTNGVFCDVPVKLLRELVLLLLLRSKI
jgi:hypothetical protein